MDFTLYNYMPHVGFLRSLFQKGIYFRLASRFEDKNEGYFPMAKLDLLDPDIEKWARLFGVECDIELKHGVRRVIESMLAQEKENVFVSCWHHNTGFSPAMYCKYGRNGVFLKTSTWSIADAISNEASQLLEYAGAGVNRLFTEVEYLEDLDDIGDDEARRSILDSRLHGRKEKAKWSFEREFRLRIRAVNLAIRIDKPINGASAVSGADDLRLDVDSEITTEMEEGFVTRVFVKVKPRVLVHGIGMVGNDNFEAVRQLCEEFGLDCPIEVLDPAVIAGFKEP